jgi:hypothetical protein
VAAADIPEDCNGALCILGAKNNPLRLRSSGEKLRSKGIPLHYASLPYTHIMKRCIEILHEHNRARRRRTTSTEGKTLL